MSTPVTHDPLVNSAPITPVKITKNCVHLMCVYENIMSIVRNSSLLLIVLHLCNVICRNDISFNIHPTCMEVCGVHFTQCLVRYDIHHMITSFWSASIFLIFCVVCPILS